MQVIFLLETIASTLVVIGMSRLKTRLFLLNKNSQRLLLLCGGLLLSMMIALIVIGIFKPTGKSLDDRRDPVALLVNSWEAEASSHLTFAKIYHAADTGTCKDILLMVWNVKPCLLAGKISVSAMPNKTMKWIQKELRESLRIVLLPSPASRCIRPGAEEQPNLYKQRTVAETGSHGQLHGQTIEENHQYEGQIQSSGASLRTILSPEKVDARHTV